MNHPGAENFGPSALLAHAASRASAEQAADVEFGAGLSERKEARAETHRDLRPVKGAREFAQHALQMRHRDPPGAVDHEAFDLPEHRRGAHAQLVAPVAVAGADHRQGRLAALHHADLAVGSMRAQQHPAGQEKRVLHLARRMVGRKIERLEVVEIVLDILGRDDLEAHRGENIEHLLHHQGQRMKPAARDARAGKGHVQARLCERALERGRAQALLERVDTVFDLAFYLVDELADSRAFFGRDLAHAAHHVRQFAAASEHAHAHRLDLFGAGAVAQLRHRRGAKSLQLFSHPVLKKSVCASSSPRPPQGCDKHADLSNPKSISTKNIKHTEHQTKDHVDARAPHGPCEPRRAAGP